MCEKSNWNVIQKDALNTSLIQESMSLDTKRKEIPKETYLYKIAGSQATQACSKMQSTKNYDKLQCTMKN